MDNILLMYATGTATGEYYDQKNGTSSEKLFHEKLLFNVTCLSIIMTDNAPYHSLSLKLDKVPLKYCVKKA
jgi:hypothetical protein